jgi:hypothetical protein
MASENKKKKLKNSYMCASGLKNKDMELQRVAFFTSAKRMELKKIADVYGIPRYGKTHEE